MVVRILELPFASPSKSCSATPSWTWCPEVAPLPSRTGNPYRTHLQWAIPTPRRKFQRSMTRVPNTPVVPSSFLPSSAANLNPYSPRVQPVILRDSPFQICVSKKNSGSCILTYKEQYLVGILTWTRLAKNPNKQKKQSDFSYFSPTSALGAKVYPKRWKRYRFKGGSKDTEMACSETL